MKIKNLKLKILVFFYFFFYFLFFINKPVVANDFQINYWVEYFLNKSNNDFKTKVKYQIKITNLRSDVYVDKFFLSFPKDFLVEQVLAKDDRGEIKPEISLEERYLKIALEFSQPNIGKNSQNNLFLEFNQDNLFRVNGKIWEVFLPTLEKKESSHYQAIINLPLDTDKKLTIAKPLPTRITGNQILWDNPTTKTIYAVFGDEQIYKLETSYFLENPKFIPVYTDIAFPPETLYQQIFLEKIDPAPQLVYLDDDGNYLGRYFLKPKEKVNINYSGFIKIFSRPREELLTFFSQQFEKQKKYLLQENSFWKISSIENFSSLKTPADVYQWVVKNLSYDYNKVGKKEERLGAERAIKNNQNAVCTEFTDVFIALAREKGIFSREIQGYGYSFESYLRPISLTTDVLHAWPEYYLPEKKIWVPVDPTWENTSGIDYFSSLDLNHIVLAIHGKDPQYPYPAGMYKNDKAKNIIIKPVETMPGLKERIFLEWKNFNQEIDNKNQYSSKLLIKNEGNGFFYNGIISLSANEIKINPEKIKIEVLAPLEEKEISIQYFSHIPYKKKTKFTAKLFDSAKREVFSQSQEITIIPYYYRLIIYFSGGIFVFSAFFFLIKYLFKKK